MKWRVTHAIAPKFGVFVNKPRDAFGTTVRGSLESPTYNKTKNKYFSFLPCETRDFPPSPQPPGPVGAHKFCPKDRRRTWQHKIAVCVPCRRVRQRWHARREATKHNRAHSVRWRALWDQQVGAAQGETVFQARKAMAFVEWETGTRGRQVDRQLDPLDRAHRNKDKRPAAVP
jgi:hypothetical protein